MHEDDYFQVSSSDSNFDVTVTSSIEPKAKTKDSQPLNNSFVESFLFGNTKNSSSGSQTIPSTPADSNPTLGLLPNMEQTFFSYEKGEYKFKIKQEAKPFVLSSEEDVIVSSEYSRKTVSTPVENKVLDSSSELNISFSPTSQNRPVSSLSDHGSNVLQGWLVSIPTGQSRQLRPLNQSPSDAKATRSNSGSPTVELYKMATQNDIDQFFSVENSTNPWKDVFCTKNTGGSPFSSHDENRSPSTDLTQSKKLRLEDVGFMETSLLLKSTESKKSKELNDLQTSPLQDSCYRSCGETCDICIQDGACPLLPDDCLTDKECSASIDDLFTDQPTTANAEDERKTISTTTTGEDGEAWKSYLEHPFTVANLSNLKRDGDSASALGMLYEFYKVPEEKRILSQATEFSDARTSDFHANEDKTQLINMSRCLGEVEVSSPENHSCGSNTKKDAESASYTATFSNAATIGTEEEKTPTSNIGNFTTSESGSVQNENNTTGLIEVESHNLCLPNLLHRDLSSSSLAYGLPDLLLNQNETTGFSSSIQSKDLFEYLMEAPKSLKQKEEDPPMSYVNKGQFYCITLRAAQFAHRGNIGNARVMSVVQVVFDKSKPEEEQLRHWKYWQSRQHTAKQRIIDIADYKESNMIYNIEEFAYNAIAFNWDTCELAKVFIACNCLSTDFSAQKGVKGLPLLLQIDTFLDHDRTKMPIHRGLCQLKIFCDKGAERKIRDEERKAKRKRLKSFKKNNSESSTDQAGVSDPNYSEQVLSSDPETGVKSVSSTPKKQDIVRFKTDPDLSTKVFHYIPDDSAISRSFSSLPAQTRRFSSELGRASRSATPPGAEEDYIALPNQTQVDNFDSLSITRKRSASNTSVENADLTNNKNLRLSGAENSRNVLMYIRSEKDVAFDGLMLKSATLKGLKEALEQKYNIPSDKIRRLLKKSRKGILVNIDDNIVCHYSNECTFIISITKETRNNDSTYSITLTDI